MFWFYAKNSNLNDSLNGFSFRKNSDGTKEVSTDGGNTWENFNSGISVKLLWTNPNPKAEFPAQKVSLDLSDYEYVIVTPNTRYEDENTPYSNALLKVAPEEPNYKYYAMSRTYFGSSDISSFNGLETRALKVTKSGIEFSHGGFNKEIRDHWVIPYKIYGVKKIKGLN